MDEEALVEEVAALRVLSAAVVVVAVVVMGEGAGCGVAVGGSEGDVSVSFVS